MQLVIVIRCRLFFIILCIGITFISVASTEEFPDMIKICNDEAEWPPYAYRDPNDSNKVIGASTEIVREIFRRQDLKISIEFLPWKRALAYVEKGYYQLLYDVSCNPEREKTYLLSQPMYHLHHGFYYNRTVYPDGPDIQTVSDVNKFRIGGVFGYNFGVYTFDVSQIDSGSKTCEALLQKLRLGRIDLAIGYVEIFQSFEKIGQLDLAGLGYCEIPESTPLVFYMMVTRNTVGEALLPIINSGLEQLKADGYYHRVFEKYGIPVEY